MEQQDKVIRKTPRNQSSLVSGHKSKKKSFHEVIMF